MDDTGRVHRTYIAEPRKPEQPLKGLGLIEDLGEVSVAWL